MIGTSANEKQLASIDGATTLGQLADDALLAVLNWQQVGALTDAESEVLRTFAAWLGAMSDSLADPLSLLDPKAPLASLPGLASYGPNLAGTALGLHKGEATTEGEIASVRELQSLVLRIVRGDADVAAAQHLQHAFETVARTMLSAADALLAPSANATWATTSAF
jgi:hypothetical protein